MRIIYKVSKRTELLVLLFLICVSVYAAFYFYTNGNQQLLYGDAVSRLNISRKILDNLTPGLAQLGNVWLPLPQFIMLLFNWNEKLWHSGLSGTIMSSFAFVIGGIFIFRSSLLITRSKLSGIFSIAVYSMNINLLYFQTTAMSEMLFVSLTAMTTYALLSWTITKKTLYLIFAALAVSLLTLTRYEGLAVLGSSVLLVGIYSLAASKKRSQAEGNVILFSTLAFLGFAIWTVYLTAIFGDPLYWKNYYVDSKTSADGVLVVANKISYLQSGWKYFTAMVWMNGLVPVITSSLGVLYAVYTSIRDKNVRLIPLVLPFAVILFMVLTLHQNTPINQPNLNFQNILSSQTSYFNEFNIRYGLFVAAWVSIFSGYLFNIRFKLLKIFLILLLLVQGASYFKGNVSLIYQTPKHISQSVDKVSNGDPLVNFLKRNYDGGLIMISALKHDPQMFRLGIEYKYYIHEGTGKYWKDSIKKPQKYATWIVYDSYNKDDQVTKFLGDNKDWKQLYNLVYSNNGLLIYRIKTKPELVINP